MPETAGVRLCAAFPDAGLVRSEAHGDDVVTLPREALLPALRFLHDQCGFDLPLDVTAVDRSLLGPGPRFEVVYHLRSLAQRAIIRLKVLVDEADAVVPSATSVYQGLNWFEREVFDMFGIRFDGHPDLRRILLYPEFVGHPLRKDYPVRGYQPLIPMADLNGDPVPGQGDA